MVNQIKSPISILTNLEQNLKDTLHHILTSADFAQWADTQQWLFLEGEFRNDQSSTAQFLRELFTDINLQWECLIGQHHEKQLPSETVQFPSQWLTEWLTQIQSNKANKSAIMNNSTEKLINIHQRRLQILQEQKAAMGILTPPHIITEIEDIQQQISDLQNQLNSPSPTPTKPPTNSEIFISYAWGGESEELVDQIDGSAQNKDIKIIRDKRDAGYKTRIKEFMQRIGRGKAIIVVISKRYLESENCMFELIEIAKNGQFYDRIFPIVLKDANIYQPIERIKYIKYWEAKIQELDEAMKTVGAANMQGFREAIDLYTEIRKTIAQLADVIADMNTLTSDIHQKSDFEALFQAIERKMTT
ncbi:MAG: toll/interleukin-1 receptor domain-containing protein [Cyanobacteria bacterium P01_F01_bin.143]